MTFKQGCEPANKGNGKCIRWIREHVKYTGDDCLIWPYNRARGYGLFGYMGKSVYAHRVMCELVNGRSPSAIHQTAHTCGKGHEGCVNPRHLVWKTPSENQLDRRQHGTAMLNPHGQTGRLTVQQWREIHDLRGRATQDAVAKRFGISPRHVRRIQQSERRSA